MESIDTVEQFLPLHNVTVTPNTLQRNDVWHCCTHPRAIGYAHDQPLYEVNNKEDSVNLSNPSLGLAGIEYAGKDGNSRALYNAYYLEFMPRVGFSWQPDPRSVIRGGYGITDDFEGLGLNLRMTQNAPFLSSFSSFPTPPTTTNSGQTPLPVENGFNLAPGAQSVSYFNFNAWNPHLRPSLIQQMNLTWQVLIDSKTTAQIGYVGQLGQHLVVPQQDVGFRGDSLDQCTRSSTSCMKPAG